MDSHIPRPLTLADLWLPGSTLDGAMLRGWTGPVVHLYDDDPDLDIRCVIDVRLDFRRPEVRDRAVRILGADLLPIHAAEVKGDITPGEAAGLVWCSVVRRNGGMGVVREVLGETQHVYDMVYREHVAGVRVGRVRDDDAAKTALGAALREPDGVLLLPLPDGIGRLDARQ